MSTPNSGTPPPAPTADLGLTANLGDTSKLSFLDDIPLDVTPETPPPRSGSAGEADDKGADDTGTVDDGAILEADVPPPVETAVTETPAAKPATNANGTVSAKKGVRDYSSIKPEDVPVFKQMSDQAYSRAVEWYKNQQAVADTEAKYSKELTELKDYRFYSHPEAYKFSPEYTTAATQYRTQSAVISHWESALEHLEAGEPIQDIAIDDKGNIQVIPGALEASPRLKAQVAVQLQKAMAARGGIETNLDSLSSKYQTKNKEFLDFTSQALNALVSPQLMENKDFKSINDRFLSKVIPPHLHDVPILTGKQAAQIMSFVQMAAKQIATLQKRTQVNNIKASALAEQGPGDGVPANGSGSGDWRNGSVKDVLAEFESMRGDR